MMQLKRRKPDDPLGYIIFKFKDGHMMKFIVDSEGERNRLIVLAESNKEIMDCSFYLGKSLIPQKSIKFNR